MLIIWPFELSELCRPALNDPRLIRIANATTFVAGTVAIPTPRGIWYAYTPPDKGPSPPKSLFS